jgi:CheY-like chemotaxis protein
MEIAEFILDKEGINITKAWNGQEAVSIFEKSKPGDIQIILMDIMMPVMNGEEASRAIRALDREDANKIPIIAMTANVFESDVKSAMQAGMNAHVGKPVDPEQLKNTMMQFL